LLAWRRHAKNLALGGREGSHHDVVLIRPIGRLSFGGEDANDAQGDTLDLNHRTDRIFRGAEQLARNRLDVLFGFLKWYESDASDKKAFAPLKSHRSCGVNLVQLTK
jgi:hypothetical protein